MVTVRNNAALQANVANQIAALGDPCCFPNTSEFSNSEAVHILNCATVCHLPNTLLESLITGMSPGCMVVVHVGCSGSI